MIPDNIFNKHRDHEVYIDENPVSRKGEPIKTHYASLRCRDCNKFLKFLSGEELVALGKITREELAEYKEIKRQQREEIPPKGAKMISLDSLPMVKFK